MRFGSIEIGNFKKELPKSKEEIANKGKLLAKAFWEHRVQVVESVVGLVAGSAARNSARALLVAAGGLPTAVVAGAAGGFVTEYAGQAFKNIRDNSDLKDGSKFHQRLGRATGNLFTRFDKKRLGKAAFKGAVSGAIGNEVGLGFEMLAGSELGQSIGSSVSEFTKSIRNILHTAAIAQTSDLPSAHSVYQFQADRPPLPPGTPETLENTMTIIIEETGQPGSSSMGSAEWDWFKAAVTIDKDNLGEHVEVLVNGEIQTVDIDTPDKIAHLDPMLGRDKALFDKLSNDSLFGQTVTPSTIDIVYKTVDYTRDFLGYDTFHPQDGDYIMEHARDGIPITYIKPSLQENIDSLRALLKKVA